LQNQEITPEDTPADNHDEFDRLSGLFDIDIGRKEKRPICENCSRPKSACWCCHDTPVLAVSCRVLVLQHPNEEKRSLRTAPMLQAALGAQCVIKRGKKFDSTELSNTLKQFASNAPDTGLLLFPGPTSVDVASLPPASPSRPYALVALDGTWQQAKSMMNSNATLRSLQKVHVIPPAVSHYVIRTQPFEMAVSTVESVALALSVLEQRQQIFDVLVQPLVKLCQHQLSHGAVIHHSKERRVNENDVRLNGRRTAKTLAQGGAKVRRRDAKQRAAFENSPQPETNECEIRDGQIQISDTTSSE